MRGRRVAYEPKTGIDGCARLAGLRVSVKVRFHCVSECFQFALLFGRVIDVGDSVVLGICTAAMWYSKMVGSEYQYMTLIEESCSSSCCLNCRDSMSVTNCSRTVRSSPISFFSASISRTCSEDIPVLLWLGVS